MFNFLMSSSTTLLQVFFGLPTGLYLPLQLHKFELPMAFLKDCKLFVQIGWLLIVLFFKIFFSHGIIMLLNAQPMIKTWHKYMKQSQENKDL